MKTKNTDDEMKAVVHQAIQQLYDASVQLNDHDDGRLKFGHETEQCLMHLMWAIKEF
jgi:hypothetical protein